MKANLPHRLLAELRTLLEPVAAAAESDAARRALFELVGWHLEAIPGFPLAELTARLSDLDAPLAALTAAVDDPPADLAGYAEALTAAHQLYESVLELRTLGAGLDPSLPFDRLGADLIEQLTIAHLRTRHPLVHDLAVLLTVIEPGARTTPAVGDFVAPPTPLPGLRLDRLVALLRDPVAVLRSAYLPSGSLDTVEQARQLTDMLFPRIARVLAGLGGTAVYGVKPSYGLDFGDTGNALGDGMLTLLHSSDLGPVYGATLALSPPGGGGLGLLVTPFGLVTSSRTLGAWLLELEAQVAVDGFAIGPAGLTLPDGVEDAAVQTRLVLTHAPDDGDGGVLLGGAGTRLEIGRISVEATASFTGAERDYGFVVRADDAALVLSAGDGFLRSVLGEQDVRVAFELGLGWSNRRGLYLEGGAGLRTRIAVRRPITPAARIDAIDLSVDVGDDAIRATAALAFTVRLGPMTATVEGLGVQATLDVGERAGNLGVANLTLAASPPTGIALTVDSGMLTGGGFLHHDADRGEYSGLVRLKHGNLVFTAVGVLSTRRPDGRPGYSLVLLVTGEFPPVQLGFGFTLNGVGGLLGVHRTANVQALQEGVRTRALDSVLFPERPAENAARILSDLQTFFPHGDGTHLFGPMAKIGWGSVPILLAELGIALEFPDPLRLLLFGQLHLGLPSLDRPLLDAHLQVFGTVDFDAGTLAIDASLVDSTIAGYRIDGDAAVRARWKGDDPDFALAIGGFHPGAVPPAGFPTLRRVSVNLTKSDNPRVRLDGYFALTSNTVQCGARVQAYAKKGQFAVEAFLSFDTLFRFDPFRFVVELAAGAAVTAFGRVITTVDLRLTLSGPRPWHVAGQASFRVIWRYTVTFDLTIGDRPDAAAVEPADLRALLLDELRRPSSWSGQLPPPSGCAVALRDIGLDAGTDALLHPQGRFGVRQTVLPLGVAVDKYGERPVKDDAHFVIRRVHVDGRLVEHVAVRDRYAPAQYFDLTDAQRLTAPAYVPHDSGISAAPDTTTAGDRVSVRPRYEEIVVDPSRGHSAPARVTPAPGVVSRVHQRSASASALRRHRDGVSFPGPQHRIRLTRQP